MANEHSIAPAILYKYFPPERTDFIENLEIRFSRPSEFNDEFDSHFLVPREQGQAAKNARFKLRSGLGVFCLAERAEDQLMWVNYARNHSGFVIGFDAHSAFFSEEGRVLRRVTYQPRPSLVAEPSVDACFYKAKAWEHECEWRCVRQFKSSESRGVSIDPSLVRHVIFGSRMEGWRISRFAIFANAYGIDKHATFYRSKPAPNRWEFERKLSTTLRHQG